MNKSVIIQSNAPVWRAIMEYRLLGGIDRKGFIYDALRRRYNMRHSGLTQQERERLDYEIDRDIRAYGMVQRTTAELWRAATI